MVSDDREEMFQHTAARRRLATTGTMPFCLSGFQHTAARRRLANLAAFGGVA